MSSSLADQCKQSVALKDKIILLRPYALAGAVGLLLGGALQWFGAFWTLVALGAVVFAYALVKRPELGLLGILVATSSIVFESNLPLVHIGPLGSFHIPDVVLLSSLGLIIVRSLAEHQFKILRTPLDLPLLAFYGVAVLSTLIAVSQSTVPVEDARRALRTVTYYLTFFVVTNLVREKAQLRLLLRGLILLAAIVALAMAAQFILGNSLSFLPGRVETLDTAGTKYGGVTRILPPGQSLVLVLFLFTTVALALQGFRSAALPNLLLWCLLGLAVVFTFNRSYWAIVAVIFFLLFWIIRKGDKQRLIGLGVIALILLVLALLPSMILSESRTTTLVGSSLGRLATLVNPDTANEGSLQWRYIETDYALGQIASHPLIGLGLGARYRPFDSHIDYVGQGWDARTYIHNAHLWIMLDTGLLGYGCLMLLSVVFLARSFRYWHQIRDVEMQSAVLGFALTYIGIQVTAIVNPIFMQWFWVPLLGIMMGVNEAILKMNEPSKSLAQITENS